ncbi:hypothetical protein DFJ74DRAFT_666656 [Hyaloraphidium curvatum]|nr:hypothetical protein DFJ74DRAFT_666656 [Hyaloraphidium curvatum]
MLACRSNYELLLSHHRTVFSEEFLNPLVAVERRLRILERSGDLDRVEELVFKEEAEWPTRCGTAVELAKRCPILSRFSVALATPDDLRLLCGAELRNLSVLELAVLCRIPEFNTSWRLHLPCLDTLVLRGIVRNEFLGMFGDDSCPRLSRIELRAHVEMANAMELHHRALSPRLIRKIKAVDVEDWSDFQEMLATGHFEPESVRQNWAADFVPETSWIALGRLASLVDLEVDQLPVPFLLHSLPPNLRRLEIDALLACGCLNRDDADGCVARLQRIPRLIIARMKDLPLNDEDYEDYRGLAPDFDDAEREERMEAERNVFRVLKRDGFLSAGVR